MSRRGAASGTTKPYRCRGSVCEDFLETILGFEVSELGHEPCLTLSFGLQMIVTTPEKWDVITRKSSDVALAALVTLLIIDEVHLLNDDRGPVIETLVARTLRQVSRPRRRRTAAAPVESPLERAHGARLSQHVCH